jgi:FAD:protein FMN transferase
MALSIDHTAVILQLTSPVPGAPARTSVPAGTGAPAWVRGGPAGTGTDGVAIAERAALGTTALVASWPPEDLDLALAAVDSELERLDRQASRFRDDSELSRLYQEPGRVHQLSPGLAEAISVALAAARWTGGLVDPTVGSALIALGYDRDFVAIGAAWAPAAGAAWAPGAGAAWAPGAEPEPVPGWRSVTLEGTVLGLAAGVRLDLGATAKGLGSDRAAAAAYRTCGRGGLLVSLGGDIAVAGQPPFGGWPVAVADSSDPDRGAPDQVVRLTAGALATSSVTGRRWQRDGLPVHHIVDPRTGWPAAGPWRTVSVAAASCAEANAAATAAIVAGPDAEAWLAGTGLPSRLTAHDGTVRLLGGWPDTTGGALPDLRRHDLAAS